MLSFDRGAFTYTNKGFFLCVLCMYAAILNGEGEIVKMGQQNERETLLYRLIFIL